MIDASSAWVSVCVLVGLLAGTAGAVHIETVPVGNPGNADDTHGDGYGGVAYTYNIGKYEVTAGQYTEFLNAVAGVDAYGLYNANMWSSSYYGCKIERWAGNGTPASPYQYRVASDYANRPVNYVSWGDSARFANWLHNNQPSGGQDLNTTEDGAYDLAGTHPYYNPDGSIGDWDGLNAALLAVNREADWKWAITTEDEWYKAAYHKNDGVTGNYYDYPTSSNTAPGRDMTDVSGNNANYYTGSGPFPIDSGKYITLVGEFQNSDSPYGTFDQGGNVWEWNEAVMAGSYRGLRGGSFSINDSYLRAASRNGIDPTTEDGHLGFHVSEVPEPATIALLALAGLALLRRRR